MLLRIITILLLSTSFLVGQITIQGSVKDASNDEPLPFVDIYFVGTTIGTTSDLDGNYSITAPNAVDSLGFNFLGYDSKFVKLNNASLQTIDIQISPKSHDLVTATIIATRKKQPKDTAAISLWRKVVQHKAQNSLKQAKTYQYEEYTKIAFALYNLPKKFKTRKIFKKRWGIILDNIQETPDGKEYLPCLMKETIKEVYYSKTPKAKKEIILADQFSGIENASVSAFVGIQFEDIDPYDNMSVLAGKSFINPFGASSNATYRYFLTDSLTKDSVKYYKLEFSGRRQQDFTFLGAAWIHAPSFAIESIELEISPHINLNFLHHYKSKQSYKPNDNGTWAPDRIFTTGLITLLEGKKAKSVQIQKTTTFSKLKIDHKLPIKIFKGEPSEIAEDATTQDSQYWKNARHEELNPYEKGIYSLVDSIKNTPRFKILNWLGYASFSGYLKIKYVEIGRVPKIISWNSIEGIRPKLRLRTTNDFSKIIQLQAFVAYGTKDREFKYGGAVRLHLPSEQNRWHLLTAEYQYDYEMLGQTSLLFTHDNIILSLLRTSPLSRIMKVRKAKIDYTQEWKKGLSSTFGLQHRIFLPVPGVFEFSSPMIDCQGPIDKIHSTEASFLLHWGPKELWFKGGGGFYRFSLSSPLPILELGYTAGIGGFMQKLVNYHKLNLHLKHRLNSPIGYTKYQIRAGKIFGKVPYMLMNMHLGNESWSYNKHAYGMMNEFEFVSDQYAALWVDHHFDGLIFNTIPLIRKLGLRSLITFKGLYGTISPKNLGLLNLPQGLTAPKFYAELGFGIENIFKLVRVDLLWRLTQLNKVGVQPIGFKVALQPKF